MSSVLKVRPELTRGGSGQRPEHGNNPGRLRCPELKSVHRLRDHRQGLWAMTLESRGSETKFSLVGPPFGSEAPVKDGTWRGGRCISGESRRQGANAQGRVAGTEWPPEKSAPWKGSQGLWL